MFWRRKGWLKKEFDEKLIAELETVKNEWLKQKNLVEKVVEPSEAVLADLKIAEAKYFFLIKEAKRRRISIRG
ncbi:YaaL family protein [Paranoxybacillus vitaminiphilus]|uniref:YaaL family protein n=1 Tax=Paranoxybacillus vitaminiphilus TaxID=581036 RepID=UPI000DBA2061|nr:YaaL family protein [Anoxybacillus vitaminiphilus]